MTYDFYDYDTSFVSPLYSLFVFSPRQGRYPRLETGIIESDGQTVCLSESLGWTRDMNSLES